MEGFLNRAGEFLNRPGVRNTIALFGDQEKIDAIKTERLRLQAAENAIADQEQQRTDQEALRGARGGMFSGQQGAFEQWAAIDPEGAMQAQGWLEGMDEKKRATAVAQAREKVDEMGRVGAAIKLADDPAAMYAQVYANAPDDMRKGMPQAYDPLFVERWMVEAMGADELFDRVERKEQGNAIAGALSPPQQSTGPMTASVTRNVAPEGFNVDPAQSSFAELFPQVEQEYQLPQGYLARTAQIESGGDPSAANPNSSARGLFQFIDSTAKQYGVNPMDPTSSTIGAGRLAADNAAYLRQSLGREPTGSELYLAHQQGAGGAAKLLANPNARAADVVGEDAVRLNGGRSDMSAGEFAGIWTVKFDGGQPQQQQAPDRIGSALAALVEAGVDQGTIDLVVGKLQGPQPQSPEGKLYADQQAGLAPEASPEFRAASPTEAGAYGAAGGQFGPDNRFYPVTPPSKGMTVYDPNGNPIVQMGGQQAQQSTAAPGSRTPQQMANDVVLEDLDRAREIVTGAGILNPAVGMGSGLGERVRGSNASNLKALTDTIRANIGFDRLQAMREASPTGGALGSITERELAQLQAVLGSIDQSQSEGQMVENLDRLKRSYTELVHGPEAAASTGGAQNMRRVIEQDGYRIEALD